ncbi:protein phosphatase 2C domain-containing protein [Streptomyces sp. NRRL S-1831]|uniref:protein phosphatase 2C domain-containing protein n=3 Tax=unclassified Streptomyces TaxID=2593676 RepID=UPI0007C804F8|nr:protein phosphatase 2C domain-containing protein [Streptomyces sp. NRRL S-1831]
MSQQGGRPTGPTGPEDDWWGQLYDDSTDDTGPTAAPDSLDDRFASASGTVARGPGAGPVTPADPPAPAPPEPRAPWWATPTSLSDIPGPRTGGLRDSAGPVEGGGGPPGAGRAPRPPGPPRDGGEGLDGRVASSAARPPTARDDGPGSSDPSGPARPPLAGDGDSARREEALPDATGAARPGDPRESAPAAPADAVDVPPGDGRPAEGAAAGAEVPPAPSSPPPLSPAPPPPPASASPSASSPPVSPAPASAPPPPPPASASPSASSPPLPPSPSSPPPPASPPPPSPPPHPRSPSPRPRGGAPRGLTTSGSGPADLREPPAPVPPPRTAADLPPPPPPFVPSPPAEPHGADRDYVGSGPPTYDAEPTALPPADPDGLDGLVPDTVLEGARYGTCTLRAVSVRGDSARYRGEPRRDALLVARFGTGEQALVLVAMATGARATAGAHRAAADVCRWIGRAVGRSHARLAEDLRAARRGDLKSGLHRLTDRSLGRLRAGAAEQGLAPDEYAATLRCLLLPADPDCRTRVFFGVGAGGLLRLRDGVWQDMEPAVRDLTGEPVLGFGSAPRATPGTPRDAPGGRPEGDRLTLDLGVTSAPGPYDGPPAEPPREPFRFRASVARPGDVLLMCTAGLAEPLRHEPALGELLARRWAGRPAPGLGEFLSDGGVRVKGYADDRTAAAVWEA